MVAQPLLVLADQAEVVCRHGLAHKTAFIQHGDGRCFAAVVSNLDPLADPLRQGVVPVPLVTQVDAVRPDDPLRQLALGQGQDGRRGNFQPRLFVALVNFQR